MTWLLLVGFGAWPLLVWVGYRLRPKALPSTSPLVSDGRFLVVLRTAKGARARQMLERAQVGEDEVMELWDGDTCRGRKGPTGG